ncbi:hypothetical protein JB92DRAFT_2985037 [Gautieria morchelliformis]|nr:hypothetical protein JB92DRAFT_2985037 [Gautieria morchelliformis]
MIRPTYGCGNLGNGVDGGCDTSQNVRNAVDVPNIHTVARCNVIGNIVVIGLNIRDFSLNGSHDGCGNLGNGVDGGCDTSSNVRKAVVPNIHTVARCNVIGNIVVIGLNIPDFGFNGSHDGCGNLGNGVDGGCDTSSNVRKAVDVPNIHTVVRQDVIGNIVVIGLNIRDFSFNGSHDRCGNLGSSVDGGCDTSSNVRKAVDAPNIHSVVRRNVIGNIVVIGINIRDFSFNGSIDGCGNLGSSVDWGCDISCNVRKAVDVPNIHTVVRCNAIGNIVVIGINIPDFSFNGSIDGCGNLDISYDGDCGTNSSVHDAVDICLGIEWAQ